MSAYDAALSLLRSAPVTAVARRLTHSKLRILAYHGVGDAKGFAAQMAYLVEHFTPVDEAAVVAAVCDGAALPDDAAWVTFDDGDPSVVQNGLPALQQYAVPATMFVCPGLIESGDPFWWRVTHWTTDNRPARAGAIAGGNADALTEFVKTIDDVDRRAVVDELREEMHEDLPAAWRQLSDAELDRWTSAGMALGNHSWDHPCLDMCTADDQRRQISDTDAWLRRRLGDAPLTFAYPNGNFSPIVDAHLTELGYSIAALYDNRLTALDSPPLQLSRLRFEADQPPERLAGVLSGAQPALAGVVNRFRR